MLKYITAIFCFAAFTANAACEDSTVLGSVGFDKNSSYFNAEGSNTLKQLLETYQNSADTREGYLLLEFEFNRNQGDEALQKYNMWLAERRIERVKEFLGKEGFGGPMVSRIRTAVDSETRELTLKWCAQESPASQMLAGSTANDNAL
ncbi:hypothetical protein MJ923_01650 [Shewanella sp. 3B26]|jgi:hypothetical protein|uniref:Uncharacterized protein n=1 Tax=Shewanella zhuhaiensis TaxID=2919576 RepID=A0AAJ1BDY2_9GAMM|nr:hypothetical protein [Shewanella zhuhaiensis]MCH4293007.1 hypothetical protein [Shewanella zhuhaiensis]